MKEEMKKKEIKRIKFTKFITRKICKYYGRYKTKEGRKARNGNRENIN